MNKATIPWYNCADRYSVTGRVVRESEKTITVECTRGMRWTAFREAAILHTGKDAGSATLW